MELYRLSLGLVSRNNTSDGQSQRARRRDQREDNAPTVASVPTVPTHSVSAVSAAFATHRNAFYACTRACVCVRLYFKRVLSRWTRLGACPAAPSAHCSKHSLRAMPSLSTMCQKTERNVNASIHTQQCSCCWPLESVRHECARLATRNYLFDTFGACEMLGDKWRQRAAAPARFFTHTHVKRYRLHCQFNRKPRAYKWALNIFVYAINNRRPNQTDIQNYLLHTCTISDRCVG